MGFERVIFGFELLILPYVRITQDLGGLFPEQFGGPVRVKTAILLELFLENGRFFLGKLGLAGNRQGDLRL